MRNRKDAERIIPVFFALSSEKIPLFQAGTKYPCRNPCHGAGLPAAWQADGKARNLSRLPQCLGLQGEALYVTITYMRSIGISAVCVAALFLGACSQMQQQQTPAPRPEETGEEQAGEEQPVSDKEEGQTDSDGEKVSQEEVDELSTAVPSSEQQEAARAMLSEQEASSLPTVSAAGEIPEPITDGISDTSLPGGRGLRMGALAPPEEAASSSENAAPKPNSVERRGLRSPSLPKGLPMDINGKLTPVN